MSYGRDYSEQRFSPLAQINIDNVSRLAPAWYADLSERGGSYETTRRRACTLPGYPHAGRASTVIPPHL